MNCLANGCDRAPRRRPPRSKVRRQTDRARTRPALDEAVEQTADGFASGLPNPARRHSTRPANDSTVFGSCNFKTRSSVRRHGTYAAGVPAVQRVVELVGEKHGFELLVFQTSRSHSAPSRWWWQRSRSSPMFSGVIRSCGNLWNVRAISSNHEYWTVESMRSSCADQILDSHLGIQVR